MPVDRMSSILSLRTTLNAYILPASDLMMGVVNVSAVDPAPAGEFHFHESVRTDSYQMNTDRILTSNALQHIYTPLYIPRISSEVIKVHFLIKFPTLALHT